MKVAFFTEGGWQGKVARNHPNMRTEMAWMCALDATHYPIDSIHMISYETKFDLGIVIIPKNNPEYTSPQEFDPRSFILLSNFPNFKPDENKYFLILEFFDNFTFENS